MSTLRREKGILESAPLLWSVIFQLVSKIQGTITMNEESIINNSAIPEKDHLQSIDSPHSNEVSSKENEPDTNKSDLKTSEITAEQLNNKTEISDSLQIEPKKVEIETSSEHSSNNIDSQDKTFHGKPEGNNKKDSTEESGKIGTSESAKSETSKETSTSNEKNSSEVEQPSNSPDNHTTAVKQRIMPLKRARTAYFIFASEKRPELLELHKGAGVAVIARATGKLWSQLSSEAKEKYKKMAIEEKLLYEQERKLRVDGSESNNSTVKSNSTALFTLPVARIRKIMKLDPEVKGVSRESLHLITKCAELFTQKLGNDTLQIAKMQRRSKLQPEDVNEVCGVKDRYFFLREDIKDLMKEITAEKKRKLEEGKKLECAQKKAKFLQDNSGSEGMRTLSSFWK